MAILYDRRIIVTVAGLTITEPRIRLELRRQIDDTQDKGEIDIYNLAPQHEERIYERGGPVTVQAGYPETIAEIFNGQAQRVVRAREKLARITRILIGDNVRHKDVLGAFAEFSLEGPVAVREIASDIAAEIGLPLGPLDAIPDGATYADFYWIGSAAGAMKHLLTTVDCTYFEADGIIRINKVNMTQSDAPDIVVSPETGMIESPIVTDEGAEIRMLLNPEVALGAKLQIKSEILQGNWKVVGIEHQADNWNANSFTTWCDLRAIGGEGAAPGP